MRIQSTLARTLAAAALGVGAATALTAPANAGDRDSICEGGEICLYYSTGLSGASWTINDLSVNWFSDETFKGPGSGSGQSVDHNSASGRNRASVCDATLATGNFQFGNHVVIEDGSSMNSFNEYNNSFRSYIFCN